MSLQEASKVSKIIYQSGLDAAESKIEFEKVQNELDHSKNNFPGQNITQPCNTFFDPRNFPDNYILCIKQE